MDRMVLDAIPFQPDLPKLLHMLHLEDGSEDAATVHAMAAEAALIARPKAVYAIAYIDDKGENYVVANGTRFTSRVMRVNLDKAQRVFAFVATCGAELETWANRHDDMLESYWAEGIMLQAVGAASTYLAEHLHETYRPGKLARMNPGSLDDWPLREQRPLFSLLGDVTGSIGVQLTDSFLMVPRKSVSGIQFPTEETFESCQLCGREACPNRRAPYDPSLFENKYKAAT